MSLVDHLLETRTPLELAKLAAATAHDNAVLRNLVGALRHEVFWLRNAEGEDLAAALSELDSLTSMTETFPSELSRDHPDVARARTLVNRLKGK